MTTALAVPERNEDGIQALEKARAFVIGDDSQYKNADDFCFGLKLAEKSVDRMFDDHIKAAHDAHKALVAKKKLFSEPIDEARRIVKGKMAAYQDAKEAERKKEEARLQELARKQAEDEQIREAERAERGGEHSEAERILSAPVAAPSVVVQKSTPKTSTTFTTVVKFSVESPNLVPREYLKPDETKIGGVLRASKGTVKIPGVKSWTERV